ncbi:ATP-binding response regulator [Cohaesibacter celericrescens]|uniref:histidine kinase n=1 Tax=Cohaesibacter celericrescens TaxID=2067669 RepID=A0A2N5XR25_9HYPH|nr:hybrid sensor histidine kinase/response regulator [Cohaesibacter celericrescens]PLW76915.1 hypothetical protein C0081_12755 [Cohaesibacter celericrescens]
MGLFDAFIRPLAADRVREHINLFLKTPVSIYWGHIASAAALLYIAVQNAAVPVWFVWSWGVLQIVGYPCLLELWRLSYQRSTFENKKPYLWIQLMDLLSFGVGASWGVMLFISLNPDNVAHFAIQMSIAAGATSAATRSLATFPRSFALYAVSFLGLLAVRLFLLGDDFIVLAGLVLVFLAMLLRYGYDVLQSVSQYIAISNENLDLAQRYRDAADEADHANREKTRLLAAASHDLRQPIHAIGLHMETLPTALMDDRGRETMQRIRSSLQTLSKLFNSLLDVGLLDSGKIQVRNGRFDLQDMLSRVVDDYEPLAELSHVSLTLECPRVGVMGDTILIRRMVQNLLSNAIRHAEKGTVRVHVSNRYGRLSIAVADDGAGIAKEHQALIFEEFTQISHGTPRLSSSHNTVASQDKGLGLGLAIVRRLADLQHLTLDLQTGPTGTCLSINGLEAAPLTALTEQAITPSERIGARFKQKRILVVDDDQESLKATVNLLNKWGCQTSEARHMADLDSVEGPFDLVISDHSFGADYTGIDIVKEARRLFGPSLKALIVSGDSSGAVKNLISKAGLLLIYKPVQPVQLRSAMLDIFLSSNAEDKDQT